MRSVTIVAAAAAFLLAGCGGGDDDSSAAQGNQRVDGGAGGQERNVAEPAPTARVRGVLVKTRSSDFGTILFSGRDQAIYLFDREEAARSECYGACAQAWPPVLTSARPRAGGRTRQGLLGTIRRRNGKRQVTYAGHPLYYYAHEGPRQVLCQNVDEFGGLWLVVKPSGNPVR